ncbi:hypothetical protein PHYPO_G00149890 [Pangasianodon hypophthalmus]|uniref:EGF-like domain-containing protein n=1 Tax=Pangasianodon hypophthalmus TaxID=310915 RepID=A0A5N5JVT4_PANHP|nr:hypothetical protein PHYPO_G00149890 [Pangasianodon hypophthalmus]
MRLLHVCLLFTFITGFNTSEEDPDPSQIPYTDSDRDLASPSRDRSTGVTRLLYIFGLRIAHTLWTASVRQGGGYSGSGDKTRLPFVPQESTHNGQEKAGSVISDLAYTATHSLTDSKLSFTEKEQDSSLSSAETRWPGLSVSTLTTATSANSNTGASTLPEKAPHTTKIYSDAHNDRDAPLVRSDALNALASKIFHSGDITVMSSASTVSRPHLTTLGNEASVTELETSESQRFHDVTDGRDASVMSSSHTANEGRNAVRHSSETFTTNRFPHPNHMNQNNADLSVTDESNFPSDSVSELEVSKFTAVTYISGGAMRSLANTDTSEIEASRTNRLPRSTHINENVSIHTHSSLVDDSNTVTDTPVSSVSHRQIDASTLLDSHVDASENTANRKRTEYYSYTPYYTSSPNTDSTPPESATTQASHTIHSEHTAVPEQTTEQQMSDANTQHTSSEILPTQSDWSSVPSTRQDFTSASASYSANTLVETFQVLLQVILEENSPPYAGLVEVEPFLQNVAGYQGQHVTWLSGPVLQSVVTFRTAEAVSWLGRAESLLQEAGLRPLPARGVFVSGVRVKNITVGGLHSDVCSWLFSCPSDFYCVSFERNVTCRSVCHSEYCKNHGICVHRSGQHPVCQCPVGEDFWFMGQRCDLRMTQQRLAGVCFGVLAAIAALMGLLAYLAVQRFKKMLIQAKAEQTQSSYRRFNHFDELSARFWRRSWPGSEDSLDNTAFSRSDELLHMRALDRACCYHDDTLSIASTYPDSVTHLNTVYPHSSQYHWDMSMCSLADGVIDSGKASDLSVCSWPIEPIQWTPFPLLQQLRNTNTVKPSRPRSYCEGMELVGLEKSRTA